MSDLCIAPHSPLVFRTGIPWGVTGGSSHFEFPPPPTIAGALRAAWGDEKKLDFANEQSHEAVLKLESKGPLLCKFKDDGEVFDVYFPKPLDAVYARKESNGVFALKPRSVASPDESGSNQPDHLQPLVLSEEMPGKPVAGHAFWQRSAMEDWLLNGRTPLGSVSIGTNGPKVESRTHVGIGREGALFQSTGLAFGSRDAKDDLGMLARFAQSLSLAGRRVGGEARSAALLTRTGADPSVFDGPKDTRLFDGLRTLKAGDSFRLILATPAIFLGGWRPGWIDAVTHEGHPPLTNGRLKLRLIAAAVDRWIPYSGWDMKRKWPRDVRRMVPAGSVYWFELLQGTGTELAALWLRSICDVEQDCLDGLGLVLPGLSYIASDENSQ